MNKSLKLNELIFIAILSSAIGVAWLGYSFFYNIISPFLKPFALASLLEGAWLFSGFFFAYVLRKPGAAIVGETLSAIVESAFSQWGITAVLYGLIQGAMVELVLGVFKFRKYNSLIMALCGVFSAIGAWSINYYLYGFATLGFYYNSINLIGFMLSGAFFSLFAKYIANRLARTGVLNQFNIAKY